MVYQTDIYMRKIIIFLIRFYKRAFSPYKGYKCPYFPSCSDYAIGSFEKHGVIKGSILTTWRLIRCNPFSHGGFDPVPEEFWRKNKK